MSSAPDLGRIGIDAEYGGRTATLTTYTLRNRTRQAWDTLARAATRGLHDAGGLIHTVKTLHALGDDGVVKRFFAGVEIGPFVGFCMVVANQARDVQETFDASVMLEALFTGHGMSRVRPLDRLVLPELLASQRRPEDLERWMRPVRAARLSRVQPFLLRANAVNPFTAAGDEDGVAIAEWLAHVNSAMAADGLEGISVAPGPGAPFDRIVCAPASLVAGGPLVSVIMPTFEPGPRIETAVESLLAQSYENFELLIMDDASSPDAAERIGGWRARDDRIRVHHLPENLGSYKARNVAVSTHARGAYITVHDDDDWSHPRKLEMQVAHLERNPELPANTSLLSRATDALMFTRINDNPVFSQRNYSSLMVRREVFDEIGYWDVVNRGADAEMIDRIQLWSGHRVPSVGTAPLSFLRERAASLTSGEISRGYLDPRRRWYADAYRRWHAECASRSVTPFVGPDDRDDRPFAVATNMLGSRAAQGRVDVDIVYATDFRFAGGNSTLACNEIEILLRHGYRVGLLQIESPILGTKNLLHPRALQLAGHPRAVVISLLDEVRAGLTIVRHPTTMQFAEPVRSRVTTDAAVVIVNHAPFEPDRTGSTYDIRTVQGTAEAVFGVRPRVAPESGLIRTLLTGLVAPENLAASDWSGVTQVEVGASRKSDPARAPVLGRHSRDHAHKWPASETFELVYPTDGSYEIRVLGGADWARKRRGGPLGDSWTVYPYGTKQVRDFLDEIDIWAYFHGAELYESFGMATLEAMAAGLVVILPPYMESTFGDGALYTEPDGARSLYERIWSDEDAYAEQSRRAVDAVRRRFGEEALLARVKTMMGDPA
ncbi:glycosyltransferase [Myceligenerans pegani]|uniref:Glycosyltransferase n=1 Tax=Myceligenerans pegani TaxID=2776917 RepID=A0ABR9N0E7_9MICO|nr:glycosyltransferase [Myceligenerans sp. TRM 65318]MBE1877123.1 glycosyltransferase [Myceligenerans sp. TRM 65318]MBE3019394.1 glycosyltransferase [Myceligenerans sp. TRM 65318]